VLFAPFFFLYLHHSFLYMLVVPYSSGTGDSELSLSSVYKRCQHIPITINDEVLPFTHTYLPMKMEQSVPKRRHINFRRRELPRRKHTTFRARRKFEIKKIIRHSNTEKYLGMTLDAHVKKKREELGLKYKKTYWLTGRRSSLSKHSKLML
jgi:hypothetical protein